MTTGGYLMGDTFQIACSACKQRLKIRDTARGKIVACPKCGTKLRIPKASLPPQPTQPSRNTPLDDPANQQQQRSAVAPAKLSATDVENTCDDEDLPVAKFLNTSSSRPELAPLQTSDDLFGVDLPAMAVAPFVPSPSERRLAGSKTQAPQGRQQARVDLSKAIKSQLSGKLPKQRVGFGYRIGLTVNAVFMMMLPLAYVGLICASIYGMYVYTFDWLPTLFQRMPRGRVAIFAAAIYIAPIVAGVTVIIFMIKPLFMAVIQGGDTRSRSINREGEPLLFELVDHICDVTGAPKPSRIDVDSDVNASASYGRGLRSLFSNDLVLTIGVPLVAGLNTREFAGVLAHEFGHFSQGAGMRASYLIRSINSWFSRVVYQRDGIDETLDDAIEDSESVLGLIWVVARVGVSIVRGVMWVFMMVAHIGSCFLLRQMEFDADRYETFVSGSETFASTTRSMRTLGHAQHAAMIGLSGLINKAVMVDDIPKMIQILERQIPPKARAKILADIDTEQTGLLDSHPSDASRIAAAAKCEAPGIWTVERPARELFRHYDGLCQNVTQDFYRNQIGRLINPNELQPVEKHLAGFAGG
ncbi:MAG: M48 family metalloprotease [Rubripirellula sp.]